MSFDVTQYLLAAQAADAKVRNDAEAILCKFREENLPQYLLSMSDELSNDGKPMESRRLAGIVLKNDLGAKGSTVKEQPVQLWVQIDVSFKSQIKNSLLSTLGSTFREASHTAALIVTVIASIEIPRKEWPELVGSLLANMTRPDGSPSLRQATLETLGYVCEVVSNEDLVQDEVNAVLTAVVQGMNISELNPEVRLAATKALCNALEFARTNLNNEMERNYIMKVICDAALAKESEIRQAAFQCLSSVASTDFEYNLPVAVYFHWLSMKLFKHA